MGAGCYHILRLVCHDLVLVVWGAGCDHFWWLVCHDLVLVVWAAGSAHFSVQLCHDLVPWPGSYSEGHLLSAIQQPVNK